MMIKRGTLALALALAMTTSLAAAPVNAQAPVRIKQNRDWGSYSHSSAKGTTCYALSIPTTKQPEAMNGRAVDHGDVYFMLARHPGQAEGVEAQFTVGYPLKENSKVVLDIDGRAFSMFTSGNNAWLENPAEESAVVSAMRAGKKMSIKAESRRGTETNYAYSLSGVTASLNDIKTCK